MADAGSFLLEYLPTTKPILYLKDPDGPGLNKSGAFTSQYYRAGNFDEIRRFISMVTEGEDPGREERLRLVSEELVRIDGQIGKSIKIMLWKRLFRRLTLSRPPTEMVDSPDITAATRTDAHQFAHAYWRNCADTFLASDPSYYDRQENELRRILWARLGRVRSALDIGCGNGRFSFVLAEVSDSVLAFDISPKLIAEATANAERRGFGGIRFELRDLEEGIAPGHFGLVACMGVISTLIDDIAYNGI